MFSRLVKLDGSWMQFSPNGTGMHFRPSGKRSMSIQMLYIYIYCIRTYYLYDESIIYHQESWDQPFYCTFIRTKKKCPKEQSSAMPTSGVVFFLADDVEATSATRRSVTKVRGSLLHFAFQSLWWWNTGKRVNLAHLPSQTLSSAALTLALNTLPLHSSRRLNVYPFFRAERWWPQNWSFNLMGRGASSSSSRPASS